MPDDNVEDLPGGANDTTDVFDVDRGANAPQPKKKPAPMYRVFADSKVAVGSGVGKMWRQKFDAAMVAFEATHIVWNEIFRYYNNNQTKDSQTPRGTFKRGDSTENVVYSNINVMLPATYSKNPEVTCNTKDDADKPLCDTLAALINTLFKRRDKLCIKPKIKKAVGIGLLTNYGVLKLDFTKLADSRELVQKDMVRISDALSKESNPANVEDLYGQLLALEEQIEVREKAGPKVTTVIPFNHIVDPHAENPDGTDAEWQAEGVFLQTAMLNARFGQKDPDPDAGDEVTLVYKPTHKAEFATGQGKERDDGIGLVLKAIDGGENIAHTDEERLQYINQYYTQCWFLWDRTTMRLFLFSKDDWTWPIWVWDDPLKLSRFFPYFIFSFGLSTGGTVNVGETAYYLDQQDEINDINRQMSRIRRTVFDFFTYNSDNCTPTDAERFINALRGKGNPDDKGHMLGIKAGDKKVSEMFEAIVPPSLQFEVLFNKEAVLASINRTTNTSDALRGVQFKTNTNEAAVQTYQESARLSVGAKVDAIEDVVADLSSSLAELCIQNYTADDVRGLVGESYAKNWSQMTLEKFLADYNLDIVPGSMEKPNSIFKKKEAVQIAQAIGQFAQAAPGASLTIMLKVLEQAFTEVNIKPEDWDMLKAEIQATMQKGISTGGAAPGGGAAPAAPGAAQAPGAAPAQAPGAAQPPGGMDMGGMIQQFMKLPDAMKGQVIQMATSGKSPQDIMAFVMQQMGGGGAQAPQQPSLQQGPNAATHGATQSPAQLQ